MYNQIFNFDVSKTVPLKIKAYKNQKEYDNHLISLTGKTQPGALYLHHNQSELSELAICLGQEENFLPYQAFVQFLRAFIPNPPPWILDGFTMYFASAETSNNGKLTYAENLDWLDAIADMDVFPTAGKIMQTDAPGRSGNFQDQAWSLVSFFINSGNDDYMRSMKESFRQMSNSKTEKENTDAVIGHITARHSMEKINGDYSHYVNSRISYNELIEKGQAAYNANRTREAMNDFRRANDIKSDQYVTWYYLGLLAYDAGDTAAAAQYYQNAIKYGADEALVLYALGLNSAAAGNNSEAADYLRKSAAADPERYRSKAEMLIRKLGERP